MKRYFLGFSALGLVLLVLLIGAAYGQVGLPKENHYKVYKVPQIPFGRQVILNDQFGNMTANAFQLEKFANPTEKRVYQSDGTVKIYPMDDPLAHQTWWRIMNPTPQPLRSVIGIDQFGTWPLTLGNPVYLLNPALKNVDPSQVPPPALPFRNHYLCYEVIGSLQLNKTVVLIDQFGQSSVVVYRSKLFCNPVEKREVSADGTTVIVYPIVDYLAHLNCYEVQNPQPYVYPVTALDQFGYWHIDTLNNDCLCLPALKEHVLGTKPSTWGQIKALYN